MCYSVKCTVDIVEYGFKISCNADFEIGCNADSRISFESEKLRNFLPTRFFCLAESAFSFFARLFWWLESIKRVVN